MRLLGMNPTEEDALGQQSMNVFTCLRGIPAYKHIYIHTYVDGCFDCQCLLGAQTEVSQLCKGGCFDSALDRHAFARFMEDRARQKHDAHKALRCGIAIRRLLHL